MTQYESSPLPSPRTPVAPPPSPVECPPAPKKAPHPRKRNGSSPPPLAPEALFETTQETGLIDDI